jgi:hypothetical protein
MGRRRDCRASSTILAPNIYIRASFFYHILLSTFLPWRKFYLRLEGISNLGAHDIAGYYLSFLFLFLSRPSTDPMTKACDLSRALSGEKLLRSLWESSLSFSVIMAILTWWQQQSQALTFHNQTLREVIRELEHQQQLGSRQTAALGLAWLRSNPNYCNSIP